MSRGPLVGLADVARQLDAEQDAFRDIFEAEVVVQRAAQLGYEARPRQPQKPELPVIKETPHPQPQPDPGIPPDPVHVDETAFWVATTLAEHQPDVRPFQPQAAKTAWVEWGEELRPLNAPERHPLSASRTLKPRLRNLLAPLSEINAIDVERMVRHVARGKPMENPPRRQCRHWPGSVLVLCDQTLHLAPFFRDQENLIKLLQDIAHGMALRIEKFRASTLRNDLADMMGGLQIGSDETVLLLSDLGSLSSAQGEAAHLWVELGRQLRLSRARAIALTPGPLAMVDRRMRDVWQVQQWDAAARWAETDQQVRGHAVEDLLVLASYATRIQTGLLRNLRIEFGAGFDAGIEAQFWQHQALQNAGALMAQFLPNQANEYRAKFDELDTKVRKRAWEIIRGWRYGLQDGIAFQEIRSLGADVVSPEDARKAEEYFTNLAAQYARSAENDPDFYSVEAWIERMKFNGAQSLRECREIQHLIETFHERNPESALPDGMDPRSVGAKSAAGPVRLAHAGKDFEVFPAEQATTRGSPLCILPSGNGLVRIKTEDAVPFWAGDVAPLWAAEWGEDNFGHWAMFKVHDDRGETITQRLRWIPAGAFVMGSPENESGRDDDEGPQHQVVFGQGFWMFETAVTQALYQAVMDDNPSGSKGALLPVETVSWLDAKDFIERLNVRFPGIDLRLPSEAEWEYACRSNTETPYSFGDKITKEQVNYEGNRGGTVEVGSLPPNGWGLYEMHGNVREWCEDTWHENYEGVPVDSSAWVDVDDVSTASRVFRGGSWSDRARDVRSADRFRFGPSVRFDTLGFRCALGSVQAQPIRAASARRERSGAGQAVSAPAILLELGRSNATRSIPPQTDRFLAETDRATISLERVTRPDWAKTLGRDRYGLCAEIEFETIVQRLRWMPPGVFTMGSPDNEVGRYDEEGPQHKVRISEGYWLFSTPVTQSLYEAVTGNNPSRFKSTDRPVENVSFEDATQFLKQLNDRVPGLDLRLPSEAEWEYASRAGTTTATYTGAMEIVGENNAPVLDDIAWYGGNSGVDFDLEAGYDSSDWKEKQYDHAKAGTRKVGLKRPNAWGLYDMLGNVWEWCEDTWHENYEGAPADGTAWVDAEDTGAVYRVFRGGSWRDDAGVVRSAYRDRHGPGYRNSDLGFRCARGRDKPAG